MLKVYAMKATQNVAVAINGNLRKNFKKDEKIITTRDEYRTLLRLGFEIIEEKEIGFKDIFSKKSETENPSKRKKEISENVDSTNLQKPPKDGE